MNSKKGVKGVICGYSLLVAALTISVILALASSCNKDVQISSSNFTIAEVSSAVAKTESVNIVSSEMAVVESEFSSETVVVSSQTPAPPPVSSKQTIQQPVQEFSSSTVAQSGLVYDVFASAENWTYVIDKTKPVPLQPAVSNDFFSNAMFVGDSITTGIDLYGVMKNAPVIAYTGINTNTVLSKAVIKTNSGKVTFLQAMSKYNPQHIYIMMGINGIAFQTKAKLISGYSDFIDSVKWQHPNAVIYLQSILPVTDKKQRKDNRFANSKINEYNAAIANLANEKGVYYLNVAEAFKDGYGNLPNNASPNDGIHFGTAYYKRWIEYLKRHTVYTGVIPETPVTSLPDVNSSDVVVNVSSEVMVETSSRQILVSRPPKE